MAFYLSPIGNSQNVDVNGNPLSGGKIFTYVAGSTTPTATYTDSTGATPQSNPIILNTLGLPDNPIWLDQSAVKIIIKDENDIQQGSPYDSIYGVGAVDAAVSFDEWVQYNNAVTYISPTSFSVVGDQRAIFQVDRRVKTQNTAGQAYSTILTSVYSAPNTTVTLTNTSGALDAGLSATYYGFMSAQNSSIPIDALDVYLKSETYSDTETDTAISDAVSAINVAQIQPVAASVASNDLTVTINPTKLDFRSTTLTSGTITTVNLASAASLVVPSGATLGTTNSVAARLVVLAINNAGTIEAAIVNVAGGIDLSETGLISTTALSTSSDSANVAYSTTARTSVAYRVVGIIDITETTAGTWATAPTLVQGAGGNALTAMSSIGYGQTWQSVTGSRTSGTTYYNTTGKPIVVAVVAETSSSAGNVYIDVGGVRAGLSGTPSANPYWVGTSAIVPVGASYVVTFAVVTKQSWSELR